MSNTKLQRSAQEHGLKRTPKTYAAVLKCLREGRTPKEAALAAGVGRTTIFEWRTTDPDFAAAWAAAVEEGVDRLEAEAYRRAVEGVAKPVFQSGECVGHVQEYSDNLLMMMMRGRRPAVYNTERHLHMGGDGGPIQTQAEVTVRFVAAKQIEHE